MFGLTKTPFGDDFFTFSRLLKLLRKGAWRGRTSRASLVLGNGAEICRSWSFVVAVLQEKCL